MMTTVTRGKSLKVGVLDGQGKSGRIFREKKKQAVGGVKTLNATDTSKIHSKLNSREW